MTDSPLLEPSIALAAYAEPLAANRRVLVFGSALGALCLQLLERGARSVHVCDPDAVRVSEANQRNRSSQISFSALADSDLSVREGAFELALIESLGEFDAVSILKKARRALAPRGVTIVACPNPEAAHPLIQSKNPAATALDYYALYDAVAAEFEHVRMLGQTPFVGYAIADFSASGEPEPALDTSFVPGGAEEPDLFLAMAANHEVRLDEFAVIQLPTRRLLDSAGTAGAKKPEAAASKVDAREVARLKTWAAELEGRAATADERADAAETELEELRGSQEQLRSVQEQLRGKLEAAEKARDAAEKARDSRESEHAKKLEAKHAEHEKARETRDAEHAQKLQTKHTELEKARAELVDREQKLRELTGEDNKNDLSELERQLAERGAEVRRLEQDLRTAERTGRELVRELERRKNEQTAGATAELERALAEREADLQAAAWTIESLTLRLELAGKPPAPPAEQN